MGRLMILLALVVACSVQILALSTQMSMHQSDQTPTMVMPQETATYQDQISLVDNNSAKASADRIRKIVEAALASRRARASTPSPIFKTKDNHQENKEHEMSETANKNNDEISKSNKSNIQNHRTELNMHPVKVNKHMIRSDSSPLTIKNNPIAVKVIDNDQGTMMMHSKSIDTAEMMDKVQSSNVSPAPKTQSKHQQMKPALSSSPVQMSSDSKSDNIEFISPWESRTDDERNTQLDAILKLVGRHVLPIISKDSEETKSLEMSETSNKNKDNISKSNKIVIQNHRTEMNMQPVKVNEHMIRSDDSSSDIKNNPIADIVMTHIKSFDTPEMQSPNVSPAPKTQIKHFQIQPVIYASHVQMSSDSKSDNTKFISPLESRTDDERNPQLDTLLQLVDRHVVPFISNDSEEIYENVKNSINKTKTITKNNEKIEVFNTIEILKQTMMDVKETVKTPQLDTLLQLVDRHVVPFISKDSEDMYENVRNSINKPKILKQTMLDVKETVTNPQLDTLLQLVNRHVVPFISNDSEEIYENVKNSINNPKTITKNNENSDILKQTTMDVKEPVKNPSDNNGRTDDLVEFGRLKNKDSKPDMEKSEQRDLSSMIVDLFLNYTKWL